MIGTSRVPFNALARGTSAERSELDAAIGRVLDRGWYALGPENAALEEELAAEVGTAHAVLVASGSDALQLAMQALGAEAGSLILTAANAGGYSSIAARQLHAVPVYADVDPVSLLLTPETLASACARMDAVPRIAVITHLYGAAADMTGIMDWAERTGVQIIEDCAQALGAWHAGAACRLVRACRDRAVSTRPRTSGRSATAGRFCATTAALPGPSGHSASTVGRRSTT